MNRSFVALFLLCTLLGAGLGASSIAHGSTPAPTFEVSGWLPYWRVASSTSDVGPHLSQMTEINPFGYNVKKDGSLYDSMNISDPAWQGLIQKARRQGVRIVPTVMWSDTPTMDAVLKDPAIRAAHESNIVAMVNQNNFDGVDIDYEGKLVATKDNYSLFLKELKAKLGQGRELSCTIEARTPIDSLNTAKVAESIEYANDYQMIGTYCDRVRLMTYDQQSIDKKLNALAASTNTVYSPVADAAWVKKVVQLAVQTIPSDKLTIGIATYGYEYDVTVSKNRTLSYKIKWSFNPGYSVALAKTFGITPERNSAGELSFTYMATTSDPLPRKVLAPRNTSSAQQVAARATATAASTGKPVTFRFVDWSDAQAIADKVALAKSLGIRGVAIFKLDWGEDPAMWSVLPGGK